MRADSEPIQRFREQLSELRSQRQALEQRWDECLAGLAKIGAPPELALLEDQTEYSCQLTAIHDQLQQTFPDVAFGEETAKDSLGVDRLIRGLENYAVQQRTRQVLKQIIQLQHVTELDFEPLGDLKNQAQRKLDDFAQSTATGDLDAEYEPARVDENPFFDVVSWVQHANTLNDQEWDQLQESVASHFGRSLATAIGRGKIFLIQHSESLPETSLDAVPPESHPELTPHSGVSYQGIAEPRFVYDFESTGTKMTGVLDSALDRMLPTPTASPTGAPLLREELFSSSLEENSLPREDVPTDSGLLMAWSQWRDTRELRREHNALHHTPAAALAEAALAATGEERVRCLFRLADQLMIDDQLDLSYQLMRILEGQPSVRLTPLPSSLIRACLLSRHVCYPQGELSRYVEDDLRKQQPKRYQEFSTEGRLAYELLCRAAALLPALLCSSTSAARLLQSFSIQPGLIQLYNYCSRIASYAERLQGKAGEMLHTGDVGISGSEELSSLRQSAHDWLLQGLKQSVTYTRSSPLFVRTHWTVTPTTLQQSPATGNLWSQWQETWLTAHRLLRPVIRGLGSERAWVKHEIERLTPILRAGVAKIGQPTSSDDQAAMQETLTRAVEFATGWLRLGGGASSSSTHLPVREMEELSVEIRERSPAVLAELRPYAGIQQPPLVRAGTFCLMRVIQRIHSLFESQTGLSWREPEFRQVLHAELLKIPCLPLNENWEPQVDTDVLEVELLEHISRGARSWREAFELHCRNGDHIATGRLLELPVWSSAKEQAKYAALRQERIAENRRDLQADVENLAAELETLSASNVMPEADRPILLRRIERLRSTVAKTLNFPITDIQIQQLRLMLQRRSVSWRHVDAASASNQKILNRFLPETSASQESTETHNDVEEPSPDKAPGNSTFENSWVMDVLWEDQ